MTTSADGSTRTLRRAPAGMFHGRMTVNNPMWDEAYEKQCAVFEVNYNKTTVAIQAFAGRPVVRSRTWPHGIRKCTQVPGGANLAESVDGNSHDFAGITPFILANEHPATVTTQPNGTIIRMGTDDRRTIFVPSFIVAPTPGDTLTQAVSGATMLVTQVRLADTTLTAALTQAHFTRYNMVTGIDLHTAAWDTANAFGSDNAALLNMNPAGPTPVMLSDCDEFLANTDVATAATVSLQPTHPDYELVYTMRRGVTMAWVDDANGAIAVGSPLTWPDYGDHLVLAALNTTSADNIIAVALQAHSGGNTEELIKVHLFADCPISYFAAGVDQTPGEQGVEKAL